MGLNSLQGLAVENDEMFRGISSFALDSSITASAAYGTNPNPRTVEIDFRQLNALSQIFFSTCNLYVLSLGGYLVFKLMFKMIFTEVIFPSSAVIDTKGASKSFPKHETRHVSEHKVMYP